MSRIQLLMLVCLISFKTSLSAAPPWMDTSLQPGARAQMLLGEMTVEEKIELLGDGFRQGNTRLGIPPVKMHHMAAGMTRSGATSHTEPAPVTYPSYLTLASTWDRELARENGIAMARDCRRHGYPIALMPGINIYRLPLNGRNFEYFGEDPVLTSRMARHFIEGLQSVGVAASLKHFVANNQDFNRYYSDSVVDERTLREIYLAAFEEAVKEARPGTVMTGHNKLNGEWCAAHRWLLTDVLREDWGYKGLIMSDWNGRHDGVAALKAGLNFDAPEGRNLNIASVLPAVESGEVPEEMLDERALRTLTFLFEFGLFDGRHEPDLAIPIPDPFGLDVSLRTARAGVVLLKNEQAVLPMDGNTVRTLLVTGEGADVELTSGGGSAEVVSEAPVTVLAAFKKTDFEVRHDDADLLGVLSRKAVYHHQDDSGAMVPGLAVRVYSGPRGSGELLRQTSVSHVAGDMGSLFPETAVTDKGPHPVGSIVLSGSIEVEQTGDYLFAGDSRTPLLVTLDGRVLFHYANRYRGTPEHSMRLEAGRNYKLEITWDSHFRWPPTLWFGWGDVEEIAANMPTVSLARESDATLLVAHLGPEYEGEDMDRTVYELPRLQRHMIRALSAVSERLVVAVVGGGSVETASWLAETEALLFCSYGGMFTGQAICDVVTGEFNPSGHLPFSWEKRLEEHPAMAFYDRTQLVVPYTEGIFVGYRGFEQSGTEPLFPFGHGLSYTTFAYSDVTATADGDEAVVRFTVTNSGSRAGREVAQIYVSDAESSVDRPPKELKAWETFELTPGEQRQVEVRLPRRAFSFFDTQKKAWVAESGVFKILVGGSAADIRLREKLQMEF